MRTIAFVEAKAESTRLPGKHMMDVGGHPLAWWPITAAINTPEIEEVVITTNDVAVRQLAESQGCIPLDRPNDLYTDKIPVEEFIRQLYQLYVHWYYKAFGKQEDFVCVRLHANTAIFDDNLLENLLAAREMKDADQARPVARSLHHPYTAMQLHANLTATVEWPEKYAADSKYYPALYSDLEVGDVQVIPRVVGRRVANPYAVCITHPFAAMHVHDMVDLEMARVMSQIKIPTKEPATTP